MPARRYSVGAPTKWRRRLASISPFERCSAIVIAIERPSSQLLTYYALASLVTLPLYPFVVGYRFARFRTLRYRFDEEGISMSWGVLFHREIHLTYSRIQDIHLASGIIERHLGLARIQIQTARGLVGGHPTLSPGSAPPGCRLSWYTRQRRATREDAMDRRSTGNTRRGPASPGDRAASPTITGQGTLPGGSYGTISVAGMARITGNVEADTVSAQGSTTVDGTTTVGVLLLAGEAVLAGQVQADRAELEGSSRIAGDLRAGEVRLSGSHAVTGSVTAKHFQSTGVFDIEGSLIADRISVELHGEARVEAIRGTNVSVRRGEARGRTRVTLRKGRVKAVARTSGEIGTRHRQLFVETVAADEVNLEATTARHVSGARVTIGPGCDITTVEYSQWLRASPDARVGNAVQIEG